jgi:hypothetical protein
MMKFPLKVPIEAPDEVALTLKEQWRGWRGFAEDCKNRFSFNWLS